MEVSVIKHSSQCRPTSDVEKMQLELIRIREYIDCNDFTDTEPLLQSIHIVNELVQLLDNSNDFYKVGGFDLLPSILAVPDSRAKAATLEVIADVVQNNAFCQNKLLETSLVPEILNLLKDDQEVTVCIKALYAISCLCRNNHEAVVCIQKLDALPIILQKIKSPHERIKVKASFLLSNLAFHEPSVRESLYQVGFIQKLVELIQEDNHNCLEHLLRITLVLAEGHEPSRVLLGKYGSLKKFLKSSLQFYCSQSEYQESEDYTKQLLQLCFPE